MEQEKLVTDFVIDCEWTSCQEGSAQLAETSCLLTIKAGERFLSRADNEFSGSVTNNPPLTAYPLAIWLAASWWRLRWEAAPMDNSPHPISWRMAHEMPSAGSGLIWPPIRVASGGDGVRLSLERTHSAAFEPLHYLEDKPVLVSSRAFERALDNFINKVITRLAARSVQSPLADLWKTVLEERNDPESSAFRQVEAMLGYDPDEGDAAFINKFLQLRRIAGIEALNELAHASSLYGGEQNTLEIATKIVAGLSQKGKINVPAEIHKITSTLQGKFLAPWEMGRRLAKEFRRQIGNPASPLSNRDLGDIFGLPPAVFQTSSSPSEISPISLAVVRDGVIGMSFRKNVSTGKRFEAARLLGDFILHSGNDSWLPATDSTTFRQKAQRAFAAQLLAPIDALVGHINGRVSEESIEAAATHFDVSPWAIQSHLVNNEIPGAAID